MYQYYTSDTIIHLPSDKKYTHKVVIIIVFLHTTGSLLSIVPLRPLGLFLLRQTNHRTATPTASPTNSKTLFEPSLLSS